MVRRVALWLFPAILAAQEAPPAMVNEGAPMQVGGRCTPADMDWAGMSCSEEEPCPVYLELTAVESVGNKIFAAGNLHGSASTLYSVLLASDDAGRTWREAFERIRGATLDRIQFLDFETGWISGEIVSPYAQDPFLLITSDGGKTWRRRPIFGENRSGALQQFWFSSRTAGSLVIDRGAAGEGGRYELYESPNGGETWMVRESSERPIKLKRIAPGPAVWRIRPDAASKSFHIERLAGSDAWRAVAAFLVSAGACKPESVSEAAPPSDTPQTNASDAAPTVVVQPRRTSPPPSLKRPPK